MSAGVGLLIRGIRILSLKDLRKRVMEEKGRKKEPVKEEAVQQETENTPADSEAEALQEPNNGEGAEEKS